ncbi:MAG: M1 family aminopeptidase, partial [Bacteroidota bacterium]
PMQGGAMEHATNFAYPQNAIDGGHRYDELWAHELSHSWFGNYVTCWSPDEMWLNEGWARYSEALYHLAVHGEASFRDYMRSIQYRSVMASHLADGEYLPLYPMPPDQTYGSTTYDKGATVAHTLRNYIGDGQFFPALQAYFKRHGYSNATTYHFMSSFHAAKSDSRMMRFTEAFVYAPGWHQFHLVPNKRTATFNNVTYLVEDFLSADLIGGKPGLPAVLNIEVLYVGAEPGQVKLERYELDWTTRRYQGDFVLRTQLPFEPVYTVIDPYEKIAEGALSHLVQDSSYGQSEALEPAYLNLRFPSGLPAKSEIGPLNVAFFPHPPEKRLADNGMRGYWQLQALPEATLDVEFEALRALMPDKMRSGSDGKPKLELHYKPVLEAEWEPVAAEISGASKPKARLKNARPGYYTLVLAE